VAGRREERRGYLARHHLLKAETGDVKNVPWEWIFGIGA